MADRDRKIANTLDTKFRIGSMNKMFTATSILQLVQAGQDQADRPARQIPHRLSEQGRREQSHHSPFAHAHRRNRRHLRTGLRGASARAAHVERLRGTLRIARASIRAGQPLGVQQLWNATPRRRDRAGERPELLRLRRQHVFQPAGMTHSGSLPEDQAVADRSIGYMRQSGAWAPNTDTLPYRGTSAGGGYSTVGDLAAFAEALMNHKLLNAEYTSMLITGKVDVAEGRQYAYGFEDARLNGDGAVGHGGGAPGMNGDLRIYPRSGYVIAVLSNLDPPQRRKSRCSSIRDCLADVPTVFQKITTESAESTEQHSDSPNRDRHGLENGASSERSILLREFLVVKDCLTTRDFTDCDGKPHHGDCPGRQLPAQRVGRMRRPLFWGNNFGSPPVASRASAHKKEP